MAPIDSGFNIKHERFRIEKLEDIFVEELWNDWLFIFRYQNHYDEFCGLCLVYGFEQPCVYVPDLDNPHDPLHTKYVNYLNSGRRVAAQIIHPLTFNKGSE